MQSRVGHGVWTELPEPAASFIAREPGRERDILSGRLCSDWVIHRVQTFRQTSLREQLADRFQFPPPFCGGLGICHLKFIERIQDNLGNNQPGILLIVGGNDVPGRVMGACRVQASLLSLHVMLPVFPLVDVREAEFPILVRLINATEESLSLLFLRKVEEYFDGPRSVTIKVAFQVHDGAIPLLPDGFPARNSSESPWLRRISGCTRTISTSS